MNANARNKTNLFIKTNGTNGNWGLWNNFTPKFKKAIPVWFPETLCDFHREMTDGKMNGNDPTGSAHWQFGPISWAFNKRITFIQIRKRLEII